MQPYRAARVGRSHAARRLRRRRADVRPHGGDGSPFEDVSSSDLGSLTLAPSAVGGGRTYEKISAGLVHTCGLTAGGAAYCWGINDTGALGREQSGPFSPIPIAV